MLAHYFGWNMFRALLKWKVSHSTSGKCHCEGHNTCLTPASQCYHYRKSVLTFLGELLSKWRLCIRDPDAEAIQRWAFGVLVSGGLGDDEGGVSFPALWTGVLFGGQDCISGLRAIGNINHGFFNGYHSLTYMGFCLLRLCLGGNGGYSFGFPSKKTHPYVRFESGLAWKARREVLTQSFLGVGYGRF